MVDGGPYDPDKAYKDSKLCNLLFLKEAAQRYGADGVTVNGRVLAGSAVGGYTDRAVVTTTHQVLMRRVVVALSRQVNAFSPGLIPAPDGFFRYQNPAFAKTFGFIATNVAKVAETNEFGGAGLAYLAVAPAVAGASGGWWDSDPPGAHQVLEHAFQCIIMVP
jgi:protochlorophyllide reductase